MELQNQVDNFIINNQCINLCCLLYLVVVQKVHAELHDAREDHHTGAGDEEEVDVVK